MPPSTAQPDPQPPAIRYCQFCGAPYNAQAKFCTQCGAQLPS
ncbi:zinc-ribbon domain-containing protein [Ruthenibacterium lactatiformans]